MTAYGYAEKTRFLRTIRQWKAGKVSLKQSLFFGYAFCTLARCNFSISILPI